MLLDSRYRGVFVRKKQCMATMLLETVYFRKLYWYRTEMWYIETCESLFPYQGTKTFYADVNTTTKIFMCHAFFVGIFYYSKRYQILYSCISANLRLFKAELLSYTKLHTANEYLANHLSKWFKIEYVSYIKPVWTNLAIWAVANWLFI